MKKAIAVFALIATIFCLSFSAYAVDFTPSVERKPAPEIVQIEDENGNYVDAIIYDETGKQSSVISGQDDYLKLVVTPVSEKDNAVVVDITESLENSELQIRRAEDVSELTPDIVDALEKVKATSTNPIVKSIEVKDLVVRDLFDVSVIKNDAELVNLNDGYYIKARFKTDFKQDDVFFILQDVGDGNWQILENYELDESGNLILYLHKISPSSLAFVVYNKSGKDIDPHGPHSPQTGEPLVDWTVLGAALSASAAIVLFAVYKKRNAAK